MVAGSNPAGRTTATPLEAIAEYFAEAEGTPAEIGIDATGITGLPDRKLTFTEAKNFVIGRGVAQEVKDRLWAHLVGLARAEAAPWTLVCAGLALRGLRNAVRRAEKFAPDSTDRADIESAAIEGFTAAIGTEDLTAPRIVARLCNAAHTEARRYTKEVYRYQERLSSDVYESHPPREHVGHVDLVLARAVTDGAITEEESEMIQDTYLEGQLARDWAEEHDLSPDALDRWRAAVRHRLAAWLSTELGRPISARVRGSGIRQPTE
ncbi:hypothetical protein [Glycomyces sp. YM15]|uniref:hypothetical protein n=1 Tax=Glycomyces sp. YM15 TaxID=2800446 RepID=UPI001966A78D|nr:hypothetical protein [Glycomyces sp. YM15]